MPSPDPDPNPNPNPNQVDKGIIEVSPKQAAMPPGGKQAIRLRMRHQRADEYELPLLGNPDPNPNPNPNPNPTPNPNPGTTPRPTRCAARSSARTGGRCLVSHTSNL